MLHVNLSERGFSDDVLIICNTIVQFGHAHLNPPLQHTHLLVLNREGISLLKNPPPVA